MVNLCGQHHKQSWTSGGFVVGMCYECEKYIKKTKKEEHQRNPLFSRSAPSPHSSANEPNLKSQSCSPVPTLQQCCSFLRPAPVVQEACHHQGKGQCLQNLNVCVMEGWQWPVKQCPPSKMRAAGEGGQREGKARKEKNHEVTPSRRQVLLSS